MSTPEIDEDLQHDRNIASLFEAGFVDGVNGVLVKVLYRKFDSYRGGYLAAVTRDTVR